MSNPPTLTDVMAVVNDHTRDLDALRRRVEAMERDSEPKRWVGPDTFGDDSRDEYDKRRDEQIAAILGDNAMDEIVEAAKKIASEPATTAESGLAEARREAFEEAYRNSGGVMPIAPDPPYRTRPAPPAEKPAGEWTKEAPTSDEATAARQAALRLSAMCMGGKPYDYAADAKLVNDFVLEWTCPIPPPGDPATPAKGDRCHD